MMRTSTTTPAAPSATEARALIGRPDIVFADEPTGNLDYTSGTEILDALWRSCVERHQTIVLVTHDSKAAAYADRVLVMREGKMLDTGPTGEVLALIRGA